jgi:hypothetical protein
MKRTSEAREDERVRALAAELMRRYGDGDARTPAPTMPAADVAPPLRFDYRAALGFARWHGRLLSVHRIVGRMVARDGDRAAGAALAPDEHDLRGWLREAHRILLEHPVAAKAAYAALAAEGRRHAATPVGASLRRRLLASPRVRRLALLFRSLTLGMLDDDEPAAALPSTYLDNLVRAADHPTLARLLSTLGAREP